MTSNSGNAIKNKMIASYPKTDRQKLAGLERHIHKTYPNLDVEMEPYLTFTKGEDKLVHFGDKLNLDQVNRYEIHHPDMILYQGFYMFILELDGPIHDIKTEKTAKRNNRYELNNIPYIVINEAELKLKLGIPKSRKLTQEQINKEFDERLREI